MPHSAIVSGSRKVIHFYELPDVPMLFDLKADQGEVVNLAAERRGQQQQLFTQMMRYFDQVGARLPKVNPDHDSEFYRQTKEYEKRLLWGPFEGRQPAGSRRASPIVATAG